jgi:hypothetical protein
MVTNPVRFHWCSYGLVERSILDAGGSADSRGVERLPFARRLPTTKINRSSYVAFNGDRQDPQDESLRFYKYFYEPLAQDHEPLIGGGPQIAVEGSPRIDLLEEWDENRARWVVSWARSA